MEFTDRDESPLIQQLRKAVFLDRDGVVNEAIVRDGRPYPPRSITQLKLAAGVEAGLADLQRHGYLLIVVTNQPDVARGTQTRAEVEAIHHWLAARLPIDDFRTCYHDDADGCQCRKPLPGLILDAARQHGIDVASSYLIGDRWRDMEAAKNSGAHGIFIDCGYNERRPGPEFPVVANFREASEWIIRNQTGE